MTTTRNRPSWARLKGIAGHVAVLLACGVLTALAMPFAPHLWLGWAASLVAATAMLSVRRTQPRIDDREVDWILAVLALGCGVWVLRQWPGAGHDVPNTIAWLLCTTACLLLVSGTRAMAWTWPSVVPALVWLLPMPFGAVALLIVLVALWVGFLLIYRRRGLAPVDQLIRMPAGRLITVAAALVAVGVAARWGVGS